MILRIVNWLWFPNHGKDLIRTSYHSAAEYSAHITDCYICTVPPTQKGIIKKKKWTVEYPNIPLVICPVPHCEVATGFLGNVKSCQLQ
jgi:hypothetical protein